jgi:RNA polymerase sigma factor (sigma-70 family)
MRAIAQTRKEVCFMEPSSRRPRLLVLSPAAAWLSGASTGEGIEALVDPDADVEELVTALMDAELVRRAVDQLPASERVVIQLRYGLIGQPMTCRQTGAYLGLAASTVHATEHGALERLREFYVRAGLLAQ